MVCALLAGRKTQTRRAVKPGLYIWEGQSETDCEHIYQRDPRFGEALMQHGACPFGQPGDELWVRETIKRVPASAPMHDAAVYAADGAETSLDTWPWERGVLRAIQCPRGLSRITLRVTSVRVGSS